MLNILSFTFSMEKECHLALEDLCLDYTVAIHGNTKCTYSCKNTVKIISNYKEVSQRLLGAYINVVTCCCGRYKDLDIPPLKSEYEKMKSYGYDPNGNCTLMFYDMFGLASIIGCNGRLDAEATENKSMAISLLDLGMIKSTMSHQWSPDAVNFVANKVLNMRTKYEGTPKKNLSCLTLSIYFDTVYEYAHEADDIDNEILSLMSKSFETNVTKPHNTSKYKRYLLSILDDLPQNVFTNLEQRLRDGDVDAVKSETKEYAIQMNECLLKMELLKAKKIYGDSARVVNTENTFMDPISEYNPIDIHRYIDDTGKIFQFTTNELPILIEKGKNFITMRDIEHGALNGMKNALKNHPFPTTCSPAVDLIDRYLTPKTLWSLVSSKGVKLDGSISTKIASRVLKRYVPIRIMKVIGSIVYIRTEDLNGDSNVYTIEYDLWKQGDDKPYIPGSERMTERDAFDSCNYLIGSIKDKIKYGTQQEDDICLYLVCRSYLEWYKSIYT